MAPENDPLARVFAMLRGSIVYVEKLAHGTITDFVVIAGERGPVTTLLGFDVGTEGTHEVGAMARVDVLARLVRAGVPLTTLPQLAHPVGADECLMVIATAEGMASLRCPREVLLRAPASPPKEATVTFAFKRPASATEPQASRRDAN